MPTTRVRRTPEDEHLEGQERLLAELTEQLLTKEAEFAAVGAEFVHFRVAYLARFAPLYAELDSLDAEILRLVAERTQPGTPAAHDAKVEAEKAQARADESASTSESAEADPGPSPEPSAELKALYRLAAKAVHPDLSGDDKDRERRTRLMVAASEAYADGDEAALRRILDGEAARPEAVKGDDIGARLVRVLRKIAHVRGRFTELVQLNEAIQDDPMWALFDTVREARSRGEDPLAETAKDLKKRIHSAKAQLVALRSAANV